MLEPIKNHTKVWRKRKKRYLLKNMALTPKFGYVSLSVWGIFSSRGTSPLLRLCEAMDQTKYIQLLRNCIVTFKK